MSAPTSLNAPSLVKETHSTKPSKHETVVVIGVGYVGLPLTLRAAAHGYRAIGFDIDKKKIAELKKGNALYISDDEQALLHDLSNIYFTHSDADIWHATNYIICVPTPVHHSHAPDLEPLKSAARIVGKHMARGALVVVESTVNPGVCEEVVLPILERESSLRGEEDFFFAHCPERINPGDDAWHVGSIPRVIGALGPTSLARAHALYDAMLDAPLHDMQSIKEAEAVKMVENTFRDVNIAFVNELAMSFDRAGIDLTSVIRGASTKPFAFMQHMPGCGVGGHCIPVDPYYLIRYGEGNGFEHAFLKTARRINEAMPRYTVRRLAGALAEKNKTLKGSTIALLGLAYKKDIPDVRESPALAIMHTLKNKGAHVQSFDPHVPQHSSVGSFEDALHGADAVLIATNHSAFCERTPEEFARAGTTIVVDGRNCLDQKAFTAAGITYRGIGRS